MGRTLIVRPYTTSRPLLSFGLPYEPGSRSNYAIPTRRKEYLIAKAIPVLVLKRRLACYVMSFLLL